MTIVGMDSATVKASSGALQKAAGEVDHAASSAVSALSATGGLPPALSSESLEIAHLASRCLTAADAMTVNSLDLSGRASLFERLEGETGLTPTERGGILDSDPLLWNRATRRQSGLHPGGYFNEVDAILHPKRAVPAKKKICGDDSGASIEGEVPKLSAGGEKTVTPTSPIDKSTTRSNFDQYPEGSTPGRPGSSRIGPPMGGTSATELKKMEDPGLSEEGGLTLDAHAGEKCSVDLGGGVAASAAVRGTVEGHANEHVKVTKNGVDAGGGVGASIGVSGTAGVGGRDGSATVTAGAKLGVSASGDAHAQIDNGHVRLGWKLSASLGLGFTIGGSVDINFGGIFGHHKKPAPAPAPKPGTPTATVGPDGAVVIGDGNGPNDL